VAVDLARNQALFSRLDLLLAKTRARPLVERVHQVRTTARRIEALIETLSPSPSAVGKKLLKRLARLRRRAGKVRDIDVQMAALRTLKIGRESERKAQLLEALAEMRSRRELRFMAALEKDTVRKLRKGLRQVAAALLPPPARYDADQPAAPPLPPASPASPADALQPVPLALLRFARLSRRRLLLTEENLHAFRTDCKRIRYVAEMAGKDPQARRVVELLKRIQDEVGDWHDWLTLTATAESLFPPAIASALIAALRNVSKAKFVHALNVVQDTRRQLLALHRAGLKLLPQAEAAPALPLPVKRARQTRKKAAASTPRRKPAPAVVAASGAA